jgi:IS5 family transposase
MFKILVLQSLYKLSDDQSELQIKGRLSFMRFLGRDFEDTEPGAKTLWLFRDTLSNKNIIDKLFLKFDRDLDHEDLFARQG